MKPIRIALMFSAMFIAYTQLCMIMQAQMVDAGAISIRKKQPNTEKRLAKKRTEQYSAQASLGPGDIVPIDDTELFATVGRGFDPITNQVLDGECFVSDQPDATFGADQLGQSIYYQRVSEVTDITSHSKVEGDSLSFGVAYKFISLGASASSTRGDYFNSVDSFGRVYAKVVTKGTERRIGHWSPHAYWLLRHDLPTFLQQCGTHYVRGVYAGHVLDDTLHFTLKQSAMTKADSSAASVSVLSIFSVGAATASAETDAHSRTTIDVLTEGRGVYAAVPVDVASDGGLLKFMTYANTGFVEAVKKSKPEEAQVLYVIAQPYWEKDGLMGTDQLPKWPEEIMKSILDKMLLYNTLQTELSELDYALSPKMTPVFATFWVGTAADAAQKETNAKQYIADFTKAANTCHTLMITTPQPPSAQATCQQLLDTSLNSQRVSSVALARN